VTKKDDVVLARLEQMLATVREADKVAVLNWLERAVDAPPDSMDFGLFVNCLTGDFELLGIKDGSPEFRLTVKGDQAARDALMNDPEMRQFYARLSGGAAVDEPKDPQ
jgi:hypothetical protein